MPVYIYSFANGVPAVVGTEVIVISEKSSLGKMNWVVVLLAILLPFAGFLFHVFRNRHNYKCNIKEYEEIDSEKDIKKKRILIDDLYRDSVTVDNLFREASLFTRKTYLLNNINETNRPREFWISIVSVVLGAFVNSFSDGKLLGKKIIDLDEGPQSLALAFFIFAMFSIALFLLVKFVEYTEDDKNQIMKYELAYIDGILDDHIDGSHKEEIQYIVDVNGKTSHVTLKEV